MRPTLDKSGVVDDLITMLTIEEDPIQACIAAEGLCGLARCASAKRLLSSSQASSEQQVVVSSGQRVAGSK